MPGLVHFIYMNSFYTYNNSILLIRPRARNYLPKATALMDGELGFGPHELKLNVFRNIT